MGTDNPLAEAQALLQAANETLANEVHDQYMLSNIQDRHLDAAVVAHQKVTATLLGACAQLLLHLTREQRDAEIRRNNADLVRKLGGARG